MARSAREIPHYYLSTTVDLGTAVDWLTRTNRKLPVAERLVPAALVLKATAVAAHRHPELNGYWIEDGFQGAQQVHLGIAISLRGGGLVAPALHDADSLPLSEVMAGLRDLVEELVRDSLLRIVPDADLDALADDAPFRDELELDSLDFLSFVELLSTGSNRRIDEDDYAGLRTMTDCITFLSG